MENEELKALKQKAIAQLLKGESLYGKDGAFGPMLKEIIDTMLDAELSAHLTAEQRGAGNKKNGHKTKTLKTSVGELQIKTPQDRLSSFEPSLIRKRQVVLADSLEPKIIGMYGLGMSYSDISSHIQEMYDMKISSSVLREVTDRVLPKVREWRNRRLEQVYPIVWLDAMYFKVRDNGKVLTKCLYNIMGVSVSGHKDILGIYISETEGANFWLQVLTDLEQRGVKDILIACTDNLTGFSDAITSIYKDTSVQKCIVHQIRNTMRLTASKDQKEVIRDLKRVYKADTEEVANQALIDFTKKWEAKYPKVTESWNRNWPELSTYFKYTAPIRKLIYTTNPIEGYHRQIRKVTKTKGAFTTKDALYKLVFLATERIVKKWNMPLRDWGQTVQQLAIHFDGRLKLKI